MSQIDADENILSETTENSERGLKLVPVSESIRYRKRAQSAEKENESLAQALAEAKAESSRMAEQLSGMELEQKLMRKLAGAGTVDLETAVLIAKARMEGSKNTDVDSVIEQLKREKQYLFADERGSSVAAQRTAPAKDRVTSNQSVLERAAKKAATTGNRADLQEYLRRRRNFL